MFKITALLLAALGVTTAEAVSDSLANFITQTKSAFSDLAGLKASAEKINSQEKAIEQLKNELKQANERIDGFEAKLGQLSTMSKADVEKIAEAKGSQAAMDAVAGIGKGGPV